MRITGPWHGLWLTPLAGAKKYSLSQWSSLSYFLHCTMVSVSDDSIVTEVVASRTEPTSEKPIELSKSALETIADMVAKKLSDNLIMKDRGTDAPAFTSSSGEFPQHLHTLTHTLAFMPPSHSQTHTTCYHAMHTQDVSGFR